MIRNRIARPRAVPASEEARGADSADSVWATLMSGSPSSIVVLVRAGLPSNILEMLAQRLTVSTDNLCATLKIKRKRLETAYLLSAADGDKVTRTVRALQEAALVLGAQQAAKAWLIQPIRSLGGVSPLSLLDTTAGFELVRETLGRIEHGICA